MHAPESWREDRRNMFTARVITADGFLREVGRNGKRIFTAVLADTTGLIVIVAWQAAAELLASTLRPLDQANEQEPDDEVWLRVDLFFHQSL